MQGALYQSAPSMRPIAHKFCKTINRNSYKNGEDVQYQTHPCTTCTLHSHLVGASKRICCRTFAYYRAYYLGSRTSVARMLPRRSATRNPTDQFSLVKTRAAI